MVFLQQPPTNVTSIYVEHNERFWRSLYYFNIYRLIVAFSIAAASWLFNPSSFGAHNTGLFLPGLSAYVTLSFLSIFLVNARQPNLTWQLSFQIGSDIIFICIIVYASGGIQSGLGVLLLVSLAAVSLISRGKLALFYASLASIGILLQETLALLYNDHYHEQYTQAGLLCVGYFAVAWLSHRLATHAIDSEQLAHQRGTDLANMAQINQLIIQDMQDGILVVSRSGEIQQHNTSADKLIGLVFTPGAASSATNHTMLVDYAPVLATRLTTWQGDTNANFDLLRLPASNALVRTRFVPIKAGNQVNALIFLEDMSRSEAEAQQLKLAALGRLTANIAHEIRNPLSAISHATELLAEEKSLTSSRLLCIIHNNTQRLNKIVKDILQFNRRNIAQVKPIDAKVFLRTFINEFCHAEKVKPEIFQLQIGDPKIIIFDQNHLNQILWNLCRNAWRYCCKKRGSIQLILKGDIHVGCISIDVVDDGPGVLQNQLKQLFEPFITTETSGTGLGLYIAREMCEVNRASLNYIKNDTGGHFRIVCNKTMRTAKTNEEKYRSIQ